MKAVSEKQKSLQKKAATLVEALPYMRRYSGQTFVIKYGGHAMGDKSLARKFAEDVVLLKQVGINPIVVHGGGPQIGEMLQRLKIESEFVDGLRVTSAATVEVAEMVLSGSINKSIVDDINRAGGKAIGISGKDSNLVTAEPLQRTVIDPDSHIEQAIDLGFVGQPASVNADVLRSFIAADLIPVIAPIASSEDGQTYNINADTMAGAIAAGIGAKRLFLLTDVAGVLDKDGKLLTDLSGDEVRSLIKDGTINGGMIPKVETCLQATHNGANAAVILDGRFIHAVVVEIFTESGAGTLIRA